MAPHRAQHRAAGRASAPQAWALIGALAFGCDDSNLVTRPNDGAPADISDAGVPDLARDAADGGCRSIVCIEDGGGRFLPVCVDGECVECSDEADCAENSTALGSHCRYHRCLCDPEGQEDCAGNPNGPLCLGDPPFCGCFEGADCPSGICQHDAYVGGSICAPP